MGQSWRAYIFVAACAACHSTNEQGAAPAPNTTAHQAKRAPNTIEILRDGALAEVAERVVPSVVNVYVSSARPQSENEENPLQDPFFRWFFGPEGTPEGALPSPEQRSLGSGVIVSKAGVILTNHHVVEGAKEVHVTLSDGRELTATLAGADPQSDLAVLKLKGEVPDLKPLEYGDSDDARLGEVVLAVGNPFGVGQTVTMGIVSATGRSSVGLADYEDYIQTDAAINPGNSGGALVDLDGRLIGINTAIASRSGGYQGVGFAIPSNMAKPIMESLLEHGRVVRGYLGVSIQDLDPALAKAFGLENPKGALIGDVVDEGPGAQAGLNAGDVIVKLDDQPIESSSDLRNLVASRAPGSQVKLGIVRKGKEVVLEARLGELPSGATAGAPGAGQDGPERLGLVVAPLDARTRAQFSIDADVQQGVVVAEVQPGGPAAQAGVRPGDVILEADRQKVGSAAQLLERYQAAGEAVLLHLARGEGRLFVAVRKER